MVFCVQTSPAFTISMPQQLYSLHADNSLRRRSLKNQLRGRAAHTSRLVLPSLEIDSPLARIFTRQETRGGIVRRCRGCRDGRSRCDCPVRRHLVVESPRPTTSKRDENEGQNSGSNNGGHLQRLIALSTRPDIQEPIVASLERPDTSVREIVATRESISLQRRRCN